MPPKLKFQQKSGKFNKPLLKNSVQNNEDVPQTVLSPEEAQKFEVELCWCIQQLQIATKSGKLNQKQVQDHVKALNALTSSTSSMIKKRQVMRLSFGDYRAKMALEEKKSSTANLKIKVSSALPSKKSMFIKCSVCTSLGDSSTPNVCRKETDGQKVRKFTDTVNKFHFVRSNNDFAFNFDVSE